MSAITIISLHSRNRKCNFALMTWAGDKQRSLLYSHLSQSTQSVHYEIHLTHRSGQIFITLTSRTFHVTQKDCLWRRRKQNQNGGPSSDVVLQGSGGENYRLNPKAHIELYTVIDSLSMTSITRPLYLELREHCSCSQVLMTIREFNRQREIMNNRLKKQFNQ